MVVIEMEATSNGILRLDLHHAKKRDQVNHIVNYVIWEVLTRTASRELQKLSTTEVQSFTRPVSKQVITGPCA